LPALAGPTAAIRRPPRVTTMVWPRSTSSRSAAKDRLASVAVTVRMLSDYLIGSSGRHGGGRWEYLPVPPEWRATTVQACGLWLFAAGSARPVQGVPPAKSRPTRCRRRHRGSRCWCGEAGGGGGGPFVVVGARHHTRTPDQERSGGVEQERGLGHGEGRPSLIWASAVRV